ncbi:hypothetical protein QYF36_016646 [Acer negundo]|nr:hypothetical protein QYF36_016646 [Acer negundo]
MKLFFRSCLLLPFLVVFSSLFLAGAGAENHTFLLAGNRTQRPDPFNDYNTYNGGWNLTSKHYWGSVGFTGAPFFIVAAVCAGSVVLYTGNGKFTISIDDTLDYVENQAKYTSDNLKNVSNYLDTAKTVAVNSVFLPSEIQQAIDSIDKMIKSASTTLNDVTSNNSKRIQTAVDNM